VNRIVLDASALLAILHSEPGAEVFDRQFDLLENAVISAVNLAEAHGKLVGHGIAANDAWEAVSAPVQEVADFNAHQARIAGGLVGQTRSLGLSLGDRSCLALAIALKAPVYTADRVWKGMKVGVPIRVIR
jgi:ribonuclease VapC